MSLMGEKWEEQNRKTKSDEIEGEMGRMKRGKEEMMNMKGEGKERQYGRTRNQMKLEPEKKGRTRKEKKSDKQKN